MPNYFGSTVEEAIQKGLKDLQVSKEEVKITIVSEGKKGFLGIGKKDANVELRVIETAIESDSVTVTSPSQKESVVLPEKSEPQVQSKLSEIDEAEKEKTSISFSDEEAVKQLCLYLTDISKELGAPAMVRVEHEEQSMVFHLDTEKQGILIGKHGKILNALQYLAQVFIHRTAESKISVVVNIGNYRQRRADILKRLAERTAEKVERTGQSVFLEPMPAFERKQVHSVLAENPRVQTHSEGDEPHRYLVVEPSKHLI